MFKTYVPMFGTVGEGLEEVHILITDQLSYQAFNDNNSTYLWDEVLFSLNKEFKILRDGFDYDEYYGKYLYIHVPKAISKSEIAIFLNNKCKEKGWQNYIKRLQTLVRDQLKNRKYLVNAIINHVNEKNDLGRTRVIMNLFLKNILF